MGSTNFNKWHAFSLFAVSIFIAIAFAVSRFVFSKGALEVRLNFYLFYFFVSLIIGIMCLALSNLISRKFLLHTKCINVITPLVVSVILISVCFFTLKSISIIESLVCTAWIYIIYFGNKYLYIFLEKQKIECVAMDSAKRRIEEDNEIMRHHKCERRLASYRDSCFYKDDCAMKINERLRSARLRLGISEIALAERSGLSIYELGDIESYSDEFQTAVQSRYALQLCWELGVDVFDLLSLEPMHDVPHEELRVYLQNIRQASGLTSTELDELIGFETGFVQKLEDGSVDLAEYPLELAMMIADETKSSRAAILATLVQHLRREPNAQKPDSDHE
jgi:hypothetical protein